MRKSILVLLIVGAVIVPFFIRLRAENHPAVGAGLDECRRVHYGEMSPQHVGGGPRRPSVLPRGRPLALPRGRREAAAGFSGTTAVKPWSSIFKDEIFYLKKTQEKKDSFCPANLKECQDNVLRFLKVRQDKLALSEVEKVLSIDANDICGLWAKAEILRRGYNFKESEQILKQILSRCPEHGPSLISIAYIWHHSNRFNDALRILNTVLHQSDLDRENKALGLMLIGTVNAKRSSQGGLLGKVVYGLRIKSYFDKAKSLAPDLTEVRLGLGSFYLLAPKIAGGSIDEAIEELEYAVKLAPGFATANARLAQAYKMKGDLEKFNLYLERAKELDPENEVVKELLHFPQSGIPPDME